MTDWHPEGGAHVPLSSMSAASGCVLRYFFAARRNALDFSRTRLTKESLSSIQRAWRAGCGPGRIRFAPTEYRKPTRLGGARAGGFSKSPTAFPVLLPKAPRRVPEFRCIEDGWPLALQSSF